MFLFSTRSEKWIKVSRKHCTNKSIWLQSRAQLHQQVPIWANQAGSLPWPFCCHVPISKSPGDSPTSSRWRSQIDGSTQHLVHVKNQSGYVLRILQSRFVHKPWLLHSLHSHSSHRSEFGMTLWHGPTWSFLLETKRSPIFSKYSREASLKSCRCLDEAAGRFLKMQDRDEIQWLMIATVVLYCNIQTVDGQNRHE